MDTNALKKFAQAARRELLAQVAARLEQVLSTDSVELREKLGVVNELRAQVQEKGKAHLIEEVAYTWFNRLCALRYMDVNHITDVGVVSPVPGFTQPEVLQEAKGGIFDPDLRVDQARVQGLLNGGIASGNPEQEAYHLLLVAVCNRYAEQMDFLFPKIEDYTELLMPEDLLSTQSVLHAVREALTDETCQDVEVIGWLYQFYISEKKDEVMARKGAVPKEDIPAVTQLFTPHWIVRYMVENSLGRLWLLNHPESKIRDQMEYYIDPSLSQGEREKKVHLKNRLDQEFKQRCRELRKNATDAEQLLWSCLRNRMLGGYKFRRQHPIGSYILDFYCHETKLCVELDGGGHTELKQRRYDADRTAILESQGIEVLRYWNHEVMKNLELVLDTILEKCQLSNPHLNPLPEGEEEETLSLGERARGEGKMGEGAFLKVDSPEELKILDPACGSGHILTYAFDLLYAIYEELGYDPLSIPGLILEKNLYGIEIDKRAAMLSSFALMMKAVDKDRRFFSKKVQPNILEMEDVSFDPHEIKAYMARVGEDLWTQDLWEGLRQFENAKTFGSLIRPALKDVPELRARLESRGVFEDLFLAKTNEKVQQVLLMSEYLSPRYQVVVANPPYMSKGMDSDLKQFAREHFPDSKADTFAIFIERNLDLAIPNGYVGMITLMSWMFLSSYEVFRKKLIKQKTILSMAHLGARAFDTIGGEVVSTTMFVLNNQDNEHHRGAYFRLVDGNSESEKITALKEAITNPDCGWFFRASEAGFEKIPGTPIIYWIGHNFRELFIGQKISDKLSVGSGLSTSDNARFVRFWWEPSRKKINENVGSCEETKSASETWYLFQKGGSFRKWFGNLQHVVNWKNNGSEIKNWVVNNPNDPNTNHWSRRIFNTDMYFKMGLTWSTISSGKISFRLSEKGTMISNAAGGIFDISGELDLNYLLSAINSNVWIRLIGMMNPTLNYSSGVISEAPLPNLEICRDSSELVEISRNDWNSHETALGFKQLQLIEISQKNKLIHDSYSELHNTWNKITHRMMHLEKQNNLIFIKAYVLQDELSPEVPIEEITLTCNPFYRFSNKYSEKELRDLQLEDTMKEFISYAVGCTFGRYSLDKPGLILANQGETVEDYYRILGNEVTFSPTETNVIPIVEGDWFADSAAAQLKTFLRVTFGKENFAENLRFIEDALGKDIEKYFTRDFYKDHVQTYKKRPIYWLFSSPKGSFNALIYMHRYNKDTVSVVLNQYLREYRDKLTAHRRHLERVSGSPGTSVREKSQALKESENIATILAELKTYEDDVLFPLASQRIEIDLDDGVVVNYAKFGEALKKI